MVYGPVSGRGTEPGQQCCRTGISHYRPSPEGEEWEKRGGKGGASITSKGVAMHTASGSRRWMCPQGSISAKVGLLSTQTMMGANLECEPPKSKRWNQGLNTGRMATESMALQQFVCMGQKSADISLLNWKDNP